MKRYLFFLLSMIGICAHGQAVYNPSYTPMFTVASKPYAISQAAPVDGRSYKMDSINFIWRLYNGTSEVLSYLNQAKYRTGQFPIEVNIGGTLNSNGTFTGGYPYEFWFRGGTADSCLVLKTYWPTPASGGTVTSVSGTNSAGYAWTISNPTTTPAISLSLTAGGDQTGTWPNITNAKFNGELPSYYLNYLNLTNTPTIPAQVNLIAGANIAIGGTYPNLTISADTGSTSAIQDSLNTRLFVDTTSVQYDTIPIFNLFPAGSTLPGNFGGTATNFTVSGGAINFTGGPGIDSFNNYITYNIATLSENCFMTARVKYNTATSTDGGISIGWQSQNTHGFQETVRGGYVFNTTDPQFGTADISYSSAISANIVNSTQINTNINANDILLDTIERNGYIYTIIIRDSTQAWTVSYSVTGNPDDASSLALIPHNTAFPALYQSSGAYSILNWNYSILRPKNIMYAIAGNSITLGEGASAQNGRFASNIGIRKLNDIEGGGADVTASVRSREGEILARSPQAVMLMIGGNDILFGVPAAVYRANLIAIRDTLVNAGVPVIWLYPTPRNSAGMLPLVNLLDTCLDFANDLKIRETFFNLVEFGSNENIAPIYNYDGTHPNDLGHAYVAQIINDSLYKWGSIKAEIERNLLPYLVSANGKNGGQTISGGYNAANNLYLQSTTNIAKGNIFIGQYFGANEALGSIAIGKRTGPIFGNAGQVFQVSPGMAVSQFSDVNLGASNNIFSAPIGSQSALIIKSGSPTATLNYVEIAPYRSQKQDVELVLNTGLDSAGNAVSGGYNANLHMHSASVGGVNGVLEVTGGVNGSENALGAIDFGAVGSYIAMWIDYGNRRVGINDDVPSANLDVNGSVNFSTSGAGWAVTGLGTVNYNTSQFAVTNTSGSMALTPIYGAGGIADTNWTGSLRQVWNRDITNKIDSTSLAYTIFTPSNAGSVVLVAQNYNIINPTGSLTTLTVTLPSSPFDGEYVKIKYTQLITTVTYSGGTVVDPITSPTAGTLVELHYSTGTTSWY
jgi:lysophospholipase L1-like esterase